MRIVAASRVLNEDDIIEAFVRHTAALVDHHILLDNGSTDRTIDILRALHGEGVPLTVLQNSAVQFCESQHNTYLYRIAVQAHRADWVVFLDADEFVDTRAAGLRETLVALPETAAAAQLRLRNYQGDATDNLADLLVPRRIGRRHRETPEVWKIAARGRADLANATVGDGNHTLLADGAPVPSVPLESLPIAHYPHRSAAQVLAKTVAGRLKVLAAGQQVAQQGFSGHYTWFLETLRDAPERLLADASFMGSLNRGLDLVADPIDYLGGSLRLTEATDPVLRAISSLVAAAEQLARGHGRLMDENASLRVQAQYWNAEFARLV